MNNHHSQCRQLPRRSHQGVPSSSYYLPSCSPFEGTPLDQFHSIRTNSRPYFKATDCIHISYQNFAWLCLPGELILDKHMDGGPMIPYVVVSCYSNKRSTILEATVLGGCFAHNSRCYGADLVLIPEEHVSRYVPAEGPSGLDRCSTSWANSTATCIMQCACF